MHKLIEAVCNHDVALVEKYLQEGEDPNYDEEPDAPVQPRSPLRMVVFRISDCLLEDRDLYDFLKITKLLLQYGAEATSAKMIIEFRYGQPNYENDSLFHQILKLIDM